MMKMTDQEYDDAMVGQFAVALKHKMEASRAKGRNGWADRELCPDGRLPQMLREHVAKGDSLDIGVLAMMCWVRHESTAAKQPEGGALSKPDSVGTPDGLVDEKYLKFMLGRAHARITQLEGTQQAQAPQARQAPVDPHREFWAIYYDNLGEQSYTSTYMSNWELYRSEAEAKAKFVNTTHAKHYVPRRVYIYAAPPAPEPAKQDGRAVDERAAFGLAAMDLGIPTNSEVAWKLWQARAKLTTPPATAAPVEPNWDDDGLGYDKP